MKKAVLKLDLHDDKSKKKAMMIASGISGVDSISMDMKDQKLTVIGDIDPVDAVKKLRKLCNTEIVSVGPAKEEEKKKEEPKKPEEKKKEVPDWIMAYPPYYHQMPTHYPVKTAEDYPNCCVIS